MTPHNYFCPTTSKFVALREFESGLTKYGYSEESLEKAVEDSQLPAEFLEKLGGATVRAYVRTEKTARRGRLTFQVYQEVGGLSHAHS